MEPLKHYLDWAFKGNKNILLYLIGAFIIIIFSLFIGQIFSVVGVLLFNSNSPAVRIASTNFFGFILSFLLIPVIVALMHRRPWWSIAMPAKKLNGKSFIVGFFSAIMVQLGSFMISYFLYPEKITFTNVDWSSWVPMLFIYLIVFFVQAGTEEMVYRGYIAQMIYRFSKSPFLVLLIPSIIFSLPHYGNIKGSSGFLALLPYILMGLMYAWLAYRSGSLWMGIGAHLANNWFITLFVGSKAETLQKISLFETSSKATSLAGFSISSLLYGLLVVGLAELMMRHWNLHQRITTSDNQNTN